MSDARDGHAGIAVTVLAISGVLVRPIERIKLRWMACCRLTVAPELPL